MEDKIVIIGGTGRIGSSIASSLIHFIENNLIFYGSLNKVKKILAFCIIESHEISKIIEFLKEFWNKLKKNRSLNF